LKNKIENQTDKRCCIMWVCPHLHEFV
jgi:hypothetical protein